MSLGLDFDDGFTFDAEGLTGALIRSFPGLVGKGCPLLRVGMAEDRSPQTGAIATFRVGAPRVVDEGGLGDSAPINFEIKALGGENGAKQQAERGARALAIALRTLTGVPRYVQCGGVTAKLAYAYSVQGPIFAGTPRGESTYRVDATFVWQKPD